MSDSIIGKQFQLGPLIGQGGMGEVYRGVDLLLRQPVAIKVLKHDIIQQDPDIVERFTREGEALRKLNHPNIVKLLASISEHDQHYLVMEYVSGGSLADRLKQESRLPILRALSIALDLADALTRAHHLQVIHRDIKPDNVLLAEDGTLRLTDFGVAWMGDLSRITQKGEMIGTYSYLAPEAWNSEPIDAGTDIWAFGVMLYEMLAGDRPFVGNDMGALIAAILSKPVPEMNRPDVPPALISLIRRMLEKDRSKRIASARLVGAELETIHKAMQARPIGRHNPAGTQQLEAPLARELGKQAPQLPVPPASPRRSARLPANFDLQINSADTGYIIQARAATGLGDLQARDVQLPFNVHNLPQMRRQIGDWVKQARISLLADNEELRRAREFGSALFDHVFTGEILDGFQASRRQLKSGEYLRVRLRVPDQLSALPWELLFDSHDQQFLLQSSNLSLVRYSDAPVSTDSLRVQGPLHVVAVLASPASADYTPIKLDQELRRLKAALERPIASGQIMLDVIEGPGTLRQLNARLRRPIHVLHILCHGDLDPLSGEGVLVFEDADGNADLVNAELLRVQLEDQQGQIRLALLNACQGMVPTGRDPFSSVGAALVRSGVAAVIAMQFALAQDAAAQLTETFYDELVVGKPVDIALTRARMRLYGRHPERLDWAIPVLFLRANDGVLFDVPASDQTTQTETKIIPKEALSTPQLPDNSHRYENGMQQLLLRLPRASAAYKVALNHQQHLMTNLAQTRRLGNTDARSAERTLLLQQLDELALTEVQLAFSQLCDLEIPPNAPKLNPTDLRATWRKALSAFFLEAWGQAEMLFTQIAQVDANYENIQERLAVARRHMRLADLRRQANTLRDENQWQAVLRVVDQIDRIQPGDTEGVELRAWAESRRRRDSYFESAFDAYQRAAWPSAIQALESLLGELPEDSEAQLLLKHAQDQRQKTMPFVPVSAPRPVPPPTESLLVLVESGKFTTALNMLESVLQQQPTDREALVWLVRLIEGAMVPWHVRLRAAQLAEQVGDPRPGVCTIEPVWRSFPSDRYAIGMHSDPFNDITFVARRIRVKAFRIARYPITVWQYRAFWSDPEGYANQRWWTPEGWRWKQSQGVTQPTRWGVSGWMAANSPVTGVSWYESAAFCQWLTWRLRNTRRLRSNEFIRLPTEAEWEVAAMWNARAGALQFWEPPAQEYWQNCMEVGLGGPAPVGLFPQGASPGGVFDLAGNVWEWCSSQYEHYPHEAGRAYNDFESNKTGPGLRGGAYHLSNSVSGWGARTWYFPHQKLSFQGFRVVLVSKGLW